MRIALGPRQLTLEITQWNADRTERPLVVLHGFLEQGPAWDAVARRLQRPVLAPDQRGHGLSDHVGDGGFYHFWDYVSDLDLLLEQLSPGEPVDLLGHSMGGTVACLFAGARPDRVRRLVLVEGLGPPDSEGTVVERARSFLASRRDPPQHGVMSDLDHAVERLRKHNGALTEAEARAMAARTTRPEGDGLVWTWDAMHRARSPRPFVESHFVRFLAAITAPTLAVIGGRSQFPGAERARHLRSVKQVVLPEAGHLVHHDAPEALAREVERFLAPG